MMQNDKGKVEFDSQKNSSNVKVTGKGHRGQKTIKMTVFRMLPL